MELLKLIKLKISTNQNNLIYKYDLSKIYYKSSRIYSNPLEDCWVLYSPDWKGYPVVVNDKVFKFLNYFENGQSLGEALLTPNNWNISFENKLSLLVFFEEKGYLRNVKTSNQYQANELHEYQPKSIGVWLHINNNCNLDCSYCFVEKFKSEMSYETIEKTINHIFNTAKLRNLHSVDLKFAGGEPTLSVAKMEYFHSLLSEKLNKHNIKLFTAVLSNGTILNDKLLAFLKRPNVGIGISLDGFGAESHDIYRVYKKTGKGSWDKIMNSFKIFKENDIVPYIMATISQESCQTLPDLVKWVFTNNYRTRLSVVRQPNNIWDSTISGAVAYKELTDAMNEAFEKAFLELEKEDYQFDVRNSLHICELQFENPTYTACCGIGSSHIVIQDDGRLASCPMTIRETNIEPSDDLISATRKTFPYYSASRNNSEEKNCLDCQWFPVCVSGCPVTNNRMKGTPFTISPLHDYYQYVIPRYINFFGKKLLQKNKHSNFLIIDPEYTS